MRLPRLAAPSLVLLAIGLAIGFMIGDAPVSLHWDLAPPHFAAGLSLQEMFTNVFFTPSDAFLFRPFAFLVFGSIFGSFGPNAFLLHFLKAFMLGAFGVSIFLAMRELTGRGRESFLAAIISMASPSVLISVWKVPEIEVFASLFFFLAFLFFIRMRPGNERLILTYAAFVGCLFTMSMFKETVRLFAFVILVLYCIFVQRGIRREQIAALAFSAILLVSLSVYSIPPAGASVTEKVPLTADYMWFVFSHNLAQLLHSFFIGGVLLLLISSICLAIPKRREIAAAASVLLVALAFSGPYFTKFDIMGMVLYSASPVIPFFGAALFAFLAYRLASGDARERFFSSSILVVMGFLIAYIMFLQFSRQYVSVRAYIVVIPFLAYMIADHSTRFWELARNKKDALSRVMRAAFLVALVVMCYYLAAASFSLSQEKAVFSEVAHEMKSGFSGMDFSNSTVLFTHEVYFLDTIDFEVYNASHQGIRFAMLNQHKPSGNPEEIGLEICSKSVPGDNPYIYVYSVGKRSSLTGDGLQGDFSWLEGMGFDYLSTLPSSSQYLMWPWDYNIAQAYQKSVYSETVLAQEFLQERAELLYSTERHYQELMPWLENYVQSALLGMGLPVGYYYSGSLYRVDRRDLGCTNWYSEESSGNLTFTWMSQNGTLDIYSEHGGSTKLVFKAASFNKPRKMEVLLNGESIIIYSLSPLWEVKEFTTPPLDLVSGNNTLVFRSLDGCETPSETGAWDNDERCLSFAFLGISYAPLGAYLSLNRGWFPSLSDGSAVWSTTSSEASIYNPGNSQYARLNLTFYSYIINRTISVSINDRNLCTFNAPGGEVGSVLCPYMRLAPHENIVKFNSDEQCLVPSDAEGIGDTRCLSFALLSHDIIGQQELMGMVIPGEGMNSDAEGFWIGSWAGLELFSDGTPTRLEMEGWGYGSDRKIGIYLNGELQETLSFPDGNLSRRLSSLLPLREGSNTIRMEAEGCSGMCAGFKSIKRLYSGGLQAAYGEGWYPETEEGFRWMGNDSTLLVYSPYTEARPVNISFNAVSSGGPMTLSAGDLGSWTVSNESSSGISFSFDAYPGENEIALESDSGCLEFGGNCFSFALGGISVSDEGQP